MFTKVRHFSLPCAQKKPVHALFLLLVRYNLSWSRSFQYYDNHTDFQENRPLGFYSRDDSMFLNDVSDTQMDRHMEIELCQWKVTVLAPDSMREKLGLSPAVFTEEFTVSSGSPPQWWESIFIQATANSSNTSFAPPFTITVPHFRRSCTNEELTVA